MRNEAIQMKESRTQDSNYLLKVWLLDYGLPQPFVRGFAMTSESLGLLSMTES